MADVNTMIFKTKAESVYGKEVTAYRVNQTRLENMHILKSKMGS